MSQSEDGGPVIDEVGSFWVVTAPGETSELDDILFKRTVAQMSLQFNGDLDPRDMLGLFTDKARARTFAVEQLVDYDCRNPSRPAGAGAP